MGGSVRVMWEIASKKWIQSFEAEHGDAGIHLLQRHGAGTTLEQQKYRATKGYTHDAVPCRLVDSTRFLNTKIISKQLRKL